MSGPVKEGWFVFAFQCRGDIELFEFFGVVEFHLFQVIGFNTITSISITKPLLDFSAVWVVSLFILTGHVGPSAERIGVENAFHVGHIQWEALSSGGVGDFQCLQLVLWITCCYVIAYRCKRSLVTSILSIIYKLFY